MAATFTLGVIGVGSMGAALVRGIVRGGVLSPQQITVSDLDTERVTTLCRELGVHASESNAAAAAESRYIVLAVKPGQVAGALGEIAGGLQPDHTLVSIAAGVPISRLRNWLGQASPAVVRVMPNTPALVGAGAIAIAPAPGVPRERVDELRLLLGAVGEVVVVEEKLMDAVTGLSGSGPAFVFVMIEALADGGVAAGLPRAVAVQLAAQTVLGAARMVLETGQHTGALKDDVASPGGTTMAGLAELERAGFRAAVLSAVRAASRRARELSKAD